MVLTFNCGLLESICASSTSEEEALSRPNLVYVDKEKYIREVLLAEAENSCKPSGDVFDEIKLRENVVDIRKICMA